MPIENFPQAEPNPLPDWSEVQILVVRYFDFLRTANTDPDCIIEATTDATPITKRIGLSLRLCMHPMTKNCHFLILP